MAKAYLTSEDVKKLRALVAAYEAGAFSTQPTRTLPDGPPIETYVGKVVSATIPAISGSTPGSGYVDLYQLDDSNNLIPSDFTGQLVFNLGDSTISVGQFIPEIREVYSGKYVTIGKGGVPCAPGTTSFNAITATSLTRSGCGFVLHYTETTFTINWCNHTLTQSSSTGTSTASGSTLDAITAWSCISNTPVITFSPVCAP